MSKDGIVNQYSQFMKEKEKVEFEYEKANTRHALLQVLSNVRYAFFNLFNSNSLPDRNSSQ